MTSIKPTNDHLDELLNSSSPIQVRDEAAVATSVARALDTLPTPARRAKRGVVVGALLGGLVVIGTTAAALPSIFEGFGRVDYQSVQEYTVDGRGPFRCEFGFRVEPVAEGKSLEPAVESSATYDDILNFVKTHDWAFDDGPVALTTPEGFITRRGDLGVMTDFIDASWKAEVEAEYPGWLSRVGSIDGTGRCVNVVDGSAP